MRNQTFRRFLSLLLALCLILGMVPSVLAEDAVPYGAYLGETRNVRDQQSLEQAIAEAPSDGRFMNIVVKNDITITSTVNIPAGVRLSIYSDGGPYWIRGVAYPVGDKPTGSMFYAYDPSEITGESGSGQANTDIRFDNINLKTGGRFFCLDDFLKMC